MVEELRSYAPFLESGWFLILMIILSLIGILIELDAIYRKSTGNEAEESPRYIYTKTFIYVEESVAYIVGIASSYIWVNEFLLIDYENVDLIWNGLLFVFFIFGFTFLTALVIFPLTSLLLKDKVTEKIKFEEFIK